MSAVHSLVAHEGQFTTHGCRFPRDTGWSAVDPLRTLGQPYEIEPSATSEFPEWLSIKCGGRGRARKIEASACDFVLSLQTLGLAHVVLQHLHEK
jgi:hypothetical protein